MSAIATYGLSFKGMVRCASVAALVCGIILVSRSFSSSEDAFVWMTETSGYKLTSIDISGQKRTSNYELQSVLNVEKGMPIFAIDLLALKNRLEALPWVKEAQVRRSLTGTLDIDLLERDPFALWQIDGKVYVIDHSGARIAAGALDDFTDLVLMVGKGANLEAGNLLSLLSHILHIPNDPSDELNSSLTLENAIRVSDRRWDLEFDTGLIVHLPADRDDPEAVLAALDLFRALDQQYNLAEREIAAVDLRQKDRIIFRLTKAGQAALEGKEKSA